MAKGSYACHACRQEFNTREGLVRHDVQAHHMDEMEARQRAQRQ